MISIPWLFHNTFTCQEQLQSSVLHDKGKAVVTYLLFKKGKSRCLALVKRLSAEDGKHCRIYFPHNAVAGPAQELSERRDEKGKLGNMSDKYQLSAMLQLAGVMFFFSVAQVAPRVTRCRESMCLTCKSPTSSLPIKCHRDLVWRWCTSQNKRSTFSFHSTCITKAPTADLILPFDWKTKGIQIGFHSRRVP